MSLIKVRKQIVPTINGLHALTLRYIFERQSMSAEEISIYQEGLDAWSRKVDLPEGERWEIKRMLNALIADEHGYWNRAKEIMKRENISYWNLYRAGIPYIEVEGRTHWNKA